MIKTLDAHYGADADNNRGIPVWDYEFEKTDYMDALSQYIEEHGTDLMFRYVEPDGESYYWELNIWDVLNELGIKPQNQVKIQR
jgi:hypothetical protein